LPNVLDMGWYGKDSDINIVCRQSVCHYKTPLLDAMKTYVG